MSAESRRLWKLNNPDRIKAHQAKFINKPENKVKKKAYDKEQKSTPEHKGYAADYQRERVAKRKDGLHYVYLLKDEHYIGVTDDLYMRFSRHETDGRNTDNYRIMFSSPDRKEAERIETQYHGMGFHGGKT